MILNEYLKERLSAGASFKEVREEVTSALVSEALIAPHGNQTKVAEALKMSRGTVLKYAKR